MEIQSTQLNRNTLVPGDFDPIIRRNLLTENSRSVIPFCKSIEILTQLTGEIYKPVALLSGVYCCMKIVFNRISFLDKLLFL